MSKKVMILGGDGYLGWSLGLFRAFNTDDKVILVDSYLKRDLLNQCNVVELDPKPYLAQRIKSFSEITGKTNLSAMSINVTNYDRIYNLIERIKPDVIVNAAQQPSAPYSMMNAKNAAFTLMNNETGCLNVLWAVSEINPEILVINVGSAGAFQSVDSDYIPSEKVNLNFQRRGESHLVSKSWLPMQASDIYHQSKVHTFGLSEMMVETKGLKTITVQQSVIFGQCAVPELNTPELNTRFNYDHIFGTVLNRFACQNVTGNPLTVYGSGQTRTNVICLCDTVKVFSDLIDSKINSGTHKVINNFTDSFSVYKLAHKVCEIANSGKIIRCQYNPRNEKEMSLKKEFEESGYVSSNIEKSIKEVLYFAEKMRYNINSNLFTPTVHWTK